LKNYPLGLSHILAIFSVVLTLFVGQSVAIFAFVVFFQITGYFLCFSIDKPNRREGIILFNIVFSSLLFFASIHYLDTTVNYDDFAVEWRDEYKFWKLSEHFSDYLSISKIYNDSFSLFIYSDLPGYAFYIGSLGYIAENFFDGNHLLLQFIGTTFWGGLSSIMLYKIFLLFFNKKISFKYVICFSLFSVLFVNSFILLRDVIIAFFYIWVFYITLKKFHLYGVLKIGLIIFLVWQLRFENALFLIIFLIYYIYNAYRKNKFILSLSVITVIIVSIFLFSSTFIRAFSTLDRYGERGENAAMEVDNSLGKSLYSLPSPVQEIAFLMTSQIMPFPSYGSLVESKNVYSSIISLLPICYTIYWFVVFFSLAKMLIVNKIYQYMPRHLILLLIISTSFLLVVTLGASDTRRIMYVYPMIFLVYAFGQSKIKISVRRNLRNEAIFIYLSLNVIYLLLKY